MMNVPAWSDIEHDARLGLVLLADACRHMVRRNDTDDTVGVAMLGVTDLPEEPLDDVVENREFLATVSIANTHIAGCVQHCFNLVTNLCPLEEIDLEAEAAEGAAWLSYYLSLIPTETVGGADYRGTFRHSNAPLLSLLGMAEATISLVEFVQDLVLRGSLGSGFTARQISYLARVDLRTVRNAMGPKGDRPIRTIRVGTRNDAILGDPLDAIEWLAGRRGFQSGGLSPEWVSGNFTNIKSREAAAALPGLVTWLNGRTTEELAAPLDRHPDRLRKCIRGQAVSADAAEELADLDLLQDALWCSRAQRHSKFIGPTVLVTGCYPTG